MITLLYVVCGGRQPAPVGSFPHFGALLMKTLSPPLAGSSEVCLGVTPHGEPPPITLYIAAVCPPPLSVFLSIVLATPRGVGIYFLLTRIQVSWKTVSLPSDLLLVTSKSRIAGIE